jgi:PQQ-dependent catabolism-associated CXXCW motif protein
MTRSMLRPGWLVLAALVAGVTLDFDSSYGFAQEHSTKAVEVREPADYRMNDYRSPVPKTLKGARVVNSEEAAQLVKIGGALLIDVYPQAPKPPGLPANAIWRTPKHNSIKGAVWLPNVGYGKLAAGPETYFKSNLERLTRGAKDKALVFFCLRDCWMSWNAAKRALSWGYTNVIWFPDGADGWQDLGNELVGVTPEAGF